MHPPNSANSKNVPAVNDFNADSSSGHTSVFYRVKRLTRDQNVPTLHLVANRRSHRERKPSGKFRPSYSSDSFHATVSTRRVRVCNRVFRHINHAVFFEQGGGGTPEESERRLETYMRSAAPARITFVRCHGAVCGHYILPERSRFHRSCESRGCKCARAGHRVDNNYYHYDGMPPLRRRRTRFRRTRRVVYGIETCPSFKPNRVTNKRFCRRNSHSCQSSDCGFARRSMPTGGRLILRILQIFSVFAFKPSILTPDLVPSEPVSRLRPSRQHSIILYTRQ